MAWKKPSAALLETFDAVVPGAPAERRLMFGFPAAFVNGHMFLSLFEEQLVLRLDEGPRQALTATGARAFEPMKGRPMKEYVVAPAALVADRAALAKWVDKALAYGRSLPPKAKAAAKKPTAKRVAQKTAAKKPSAKRAAQKTAAQKPTAQKPTTQQRSAQKPTAKKPKAAKKKAT